MPSGSPSMAMGSTASVSGKPCGNWRPGLQHRVAADRPEGCQLGRLQHVQHRRFGDNLEAAVEAPVGAVGAVQHPEPALRRNGHVERRERYGLRELQPRRLAARVQVEDQQPVAGQIADHQIVMLGDHHASQVNGSGRGPARPGRTHRLAAAAGSTGKLPVDRWSHVASRLPPDALAILTDPPDIAEPVHSRAPPRLSQQRVVAPAAREDRQQRPQRQRRVRASQARSAQPPALPGSVPRRQSASP